MSESELRQKIDDILASIGTVKKLVDSIESALDNIPALSLYFDWAGEQKPAIVDVDLILEELGSLEQIIEGLEDESAHAWNVLAEAKTNGELSALIQNASNEVNVTRESDDPDEPDYNPEDH